MERYYVDLTNLPPAVQADEVARMDSWSFMAIARLENGVLAGATVYWDRREDFASSGVLPEGSAFWLMPPDPG